MSKYLVESNGGVAGTVAAVIEADSPDEAREINAAAFRQDTAEFDDAAMAELHVLFGEGFQDPREVSDDDEYVVRHHEQGKPILNKDSVAVPA